MNPETKPLSLTDGSSSFARYDEAVAYLEDRVNYETFRSIPYKELEDRLVALRDLLDFLGSPDKNCTIIHVAGTKGKGSTCIFLEYILHAAGYRVGRFSSPHLHSLMERFTVNTVPCEEDSFAEILFELKDRIAEWETTSKFAVMLRFPLTYFELTTIFAFEYFVRQKVDFAVMEVGLGGRLDSTNVCQPAITIISNIGFDHIEQLGPTLEDIAGEKGGIIKPGIPVISGVRKKGPAGTISKLADAAKAPLYRYGRDFKSTLCPNATDTQELDFVTVFDYETKSKKFVTPRKLPKLVCHTWGEHQARNAALAVSAMSLLEEKGWTIPEEAIRQGILSVKLPARVEICARHPLIIVDGAHNHESVSELIRTLQTHCRKVGKKFLLFGSMLAKDNEGMLQELVAYFDWIIFTQHPNCTRSFPPQGLYNIAVSCTSKSSEHFRKTLREIDQTPIPIGKHGIGEVIPDIREAFDKALALADANDLICTTGSLYLAADIRMILKHTKNSRERSVAQ